MSDDKKHDDVGGCEAVIVRHGPNCAVTKAFREVAEHVVNKAGEEADGVKGGPANYTTNAYRSGYDGINWGGRKEIGQA